jgi:potassium-transporting ATPase potassium-binding subunit
MTWQGWLQIGLTFLLGLLISIPVGGYLARVVTDQKTLLDGVLDPIDNSLYVLIGRRICSEPMDWKAYTLHMLATNLMMALIIFLVLVFQDHLPLNPQHFTGMEPLLAFNTAVSFITNTDWQGYGGETTLSNFSQMAAITFPMFASATTGFVVAMAFIRAFTVKGGGANLGNFYRDLIRFTTRVLMPASFVLALLLIQQGEPQTVVASATAHTMEGADQTIALGPVASLETIKHLGTNGGGFFNANASHPFENPTPITNLVETLLMIVLPSSIVLCFGRTTGSPRQGWVLYGVMAVLLILFLPVVVVPEQAGTPVLAQAGIDMAASAAQPGGNMEGRKSGLASSKADCSALSPLASRQAA